MNKATKELRKKINRNRKYYNNLLMKIENGKRKSRNEKKELMYIYNIHNSPYVIEYKDIKKYQLIKSIRKHITQIPQINL